jgi:hypothetical protein
VASAAAALFGAGLGGALDASGGKLNPIAAATIAHGTARKSAPAHRANTFGASMTGLRQMQRTFRAGPR